ncbi:glyoxylase I 4-like [Prosopis cineraria]|uniref:glyoxylase I 4-like n=1 Tax=Prosopis cineraria TaxID=364024 RepID=UPI00240FECAA|nr:glyoxylase I 4-like [Prosopis cineraria]
METQEVREMRSEKAEDRERNGEKKPEKGKEKEKEGVPPLKALNHVSRVCRDVKESIEFYTKVLGFVEIERPQVLDFEGAWLFNYGVGIHLVQCHDDHKLPSDTQHLDPQDNHISFQCEDMEGMEERLKKMNVKYMKKTMEAEDGTVMDQIFFNDPDGFMVELCNCEDLKLVPSSPTSLPRIKLPSHHHYPPVETSHAATRRHEKL